MQAKEIINRSKKNLTNKFTGMNTEKISGAIQDKFQFNIVNGTTTAKRVALVGAYFPRLTPIEDTINALATSVDVVTEVDFTSEKVTKVTGWILKKNTASALNQIAIAPMVAAGYPVDVMLNDAAIPDWKGGLVTMSAQNSTKKIADMLEYIRTNPVVLKEMTIVSSDKNAFQADMEVVKVNPFKRNPEEVIDLNKFFSKYQFVADRIDVVLDQPLELSDDLLWIVTVPAGASMNFTWRF